MKELYKVKKISYEDTKPYLLGIHYAKRMPSVSYAYGLFLNNKLCGVVTYGKPPSATLRKGLAGEKNIKYVLELNRLCLKNNLKNEASILISRSLKKLPKSIVIADKYRGVKNRAEAIRSDYGDKFYLKPRPRKHRYVFLIGNKSDKKKFKKQLNYEIKPYPKEKQNDR